MKRFKTTILPMNLQYFAEPDSDTDSENSNNDGADSQEASDSEDSSDRNNEESENSDEGGKTDAIIEKLNGRIGKKQGKKNELQEQLEKAQTELEKLRGKKTDKPATQTPEQKEVAELKAQIARRDTVDETVSVFSESGVNIPKDIVEVLVTNDHDQTIDNASKLLKFVTSIQKDTETSVRKEYQAGKIPGDTKHKTESLADLGESIAKSNQSRASLDSFK